MQTTAARKVKQRVIPSTTSGEGKEFREAHCFEGTGNKRGPNTKAGSWESPACGRIDLAKEAAWSSCEDFRVLEARVAGEYLPPRVWDRIRHSEVPALDVVLDDHQAPGRAQISANQSNDGPLVFLEVKRVRHDDSVERRQRKRQGEVSLPVEKYDLWEAGRNCVGVGPQGPAVPVNGVNLPTRA